DLRSVVATEFNIEGNPSEEKFVRLVLDVKPDQVTLVPDALGAITSNAGWDTVAHRERLSTWADTFRSAGIRVSFFVNPDPVMVEGAFQCGADRVELYTEPYAAHYPNDRLQA